MTQDQNIKPKREAEQAVMVDVQQDLLRFLTRRLGNAEEAADVLQDFYVKVLTRIDDVRDTDKLRGWLRRVLETTLIDYYRSQGRRRKSEADYNNLAPTHVAGEVEDDFDQIICSCLYKLLPTLKPEYADVLWRADLLGESRESIAAALDISESNVRVRLHRARQALRKRLEETCRTCPVHGYLDCGCEYTSSLRAKIDSGTSKL